MHLFARRAGGRERDRVLAGHGLCGGSQQDPILRLIRGHHQARHILAVDGHAPRLGVEHEIERIGCRRNLDGFAHAELVAGLQHQHGSGGLRRRAKRAAQKQSGGNRYAAERTTGTLLRVTSHATDVDASVRKIAQANLNLQRRTGDRRDFREITYGGSAPIPGQS